MTIQSYKINFAKQFYKTDSLPLSSQRVVNMYAEFNDDTRSEISLFSSPGLRQVLTFDESLPVYAMQVMGNFLYAVVGTSLYQIDADLNKVLKGTLPTTLNKVRLSNNGNQLTILTEVGRSFVYNFSGDTFLEITDPDYSLASDLTFIDNYTVFSKKDSDQFFFSKLGDSTVFDALDFQTAEWEPDKLVAIRKFQGSLWAFGSRTIEVYQNVGGNLVFQRINGASMDRGCSSRDSVARIDKSIFWIGDDRYIYTASGYQYQKISTFPIDNELKNFSNSDIENASAFTYSFKGHKFYCLNFSDKNLTFEYDLSNGLWHERESVNSSKNITTRWIGNCFARFSEYNLIGDFKTGILYDLDDSIFSEGNERLITTIITPILFNNFKRAIVSALYLDIETGVGDILGDYIDPQVMLQISKDGGRTYGDEIWRTIGKIGEYKTRVVFRPIGFSDNFTFKIRISDKVKKNILGAFINFEECNN